MAKIDIVPAGNRRFQVEIENDQGQQSTHSVSVPDEVGDFDDLSLQDLVLAAVELSVDPGDHGKLPAELTITDLTEDLDRVEARARELAAGRGTPTGMHVEDADQPDKDERLVQETIEAQEEGQATPGQERI